VFALAVLVLRAIPVLGDIVLLMLLPSVLASYALHVHLIALTGTAPRAVRSGGAPAYERWVRELHQALFGVWSKTENIFPLILVGLVLVVFGLVIHVLFSQVAGQAAVSPYGFFELSPEQMTRLMLGYGLAALLWIGVMVLLLWTLPLFALRDMVLLDAVAWNVRAFFQQCRGGVAAAAGAGRGARAGHAAQAVVTDRPSRRAVAVADVAGGAVRVQRLLQLPAGVRRRRSDAAPSTAGRAPLIGLAAARWHVSGSVRFSV